MTIATELTKLETNLNNAYSSLQSKGATISGNKNFDNLSIDIDTIPGLDGLGRELRAAYAWTNVQEGSGKSQIAKPLSESIICKSELFDKINTGYTYAIINNYPYTVSISNNQILLTQLRTTHDWEIMISNAGSGIGILNGQYNGSGQTINVENYVVSRGSNGLIINSKRVDLMEDDGIWTSIGTYGYGIRNGYLARYSSTYGLSTFNDFKVGDNFYIVYISENATVIDNNLDVYYITYSAGSFTGATKKRTLEKTPKKLYTGNITDSNSYGILYEDNTFEIYRNNILKTYTDVKDVIVWSNSFGYYILKNNGDLYKTSYNSSKISETFVENLGVNATIYSNEDCYMNGSVQFFKISYLDTNPVYNTLYTPSVIGTKAYINTKTLSSNIITSTSSNSITVGGKTYIRDTSKDSYFTFVPEELANHTFTDQEVCQAALSAGL